LAKSAIEVADVQPGSEARLRHFLESAIVQVNAELAPAGERPESEERADEDSAAADRQEQADREMTEALRAFAQR
jgi:hypothetical protein